MLHLSRKSSIASAVALALSVSALLSAGSAMATEKYYGGGSTFAAPPYVGGDYLNENPEARLSTNAGNNAGVGYTTADITAGSIFANFTSVTKEDVSYCQTGSGFGKNSLNGSASAPANGSCTDYSNNSPAGLSSTRATPDFIGTDSPYNTNDYNAFLSGPELGAHVGVVQVPTIAGAVALATGTGVTNNVKLTVGQVCKIYSGVITTWAPIAGSGSTGPITIVYRTDGSGTSFAFTRFLAASCNGTGNVPKGFVFTPNQTFNSAIPGGVTGVYKTRAVGESGNPGVVGETVLTASALGYADVGEVLLEAADYALVNGYDPTQFGLDPTTGDPTPLKVAAAQLLTGMVLDPTTAAPVAVPGSSSQAIKNCVRVVNPAIKLTDTYPIVAFTYLAGYTNGNLTATHVTNLKKLYNQFYWTSRPVLPQGFAYINGYAAFGTSAEATVNACVAL